MVFFPNFALEHRFLQLIFAFHNKIQAWKYAHCTVMIAASFLLINTKSNNFLYIGQFLRYLHQMLYAVR